MNLNFLVIRAVPILIGGCLCSGTAAVAQNYTPTYAMTKPSNSHPSRRKQHKMAEQVNSWKKQRQSQAASMRANQHTDPNEKKSMMDNIKSKMPFGKGKHKQHTDDTPPSLFGYGQPSEEEMKRHHKPE